MGTLLSEKDLLRLPLRAIVAFAVRCAMRVHHLYKGPAENHIALAINEARRFSLGEADVSATEAHALAAAAAFATDSDRYRTASAHTNAVLTRNDAARSDSDDHADAVAAAAAAAAAARDAASAAFAAAAARDAAAAAAHAEANAAPIRVARAAVAAAAQAAQAARGAQDDKAFAASARADLQALSRLGGSAVPRSFYDRDLWVVSNPSYDETRFEKWKSQPAGFSLRVDTGEATAQDVADALNALSDFFRAHGGLGLEFAQENGQLKVMEARR